MNGAVPSKFCFINILRAFFSKIRRRFPRSSLFFIFKILLRAKTVPYPKNKHKKNLALGKKSP